MIESLTSALTGGIFGTLRKFADAGLGLVQDRIELLAVELREEKSRFIQVFAYGAALVFFGFQALTAIMITLALCFKDQAIYVFLGFSIFYVIAALGIFLALKKRLKGIPFGETIDQLKRDREWIRSHGEE